MLNVLHSITAPFHDVWLWGLNNWYDFVTVLMGKENHEQATLCFMLFALCTVSLIIFLIMSWRRPESPLERFLAARELTLALLIGQFLGLQYGSFDNFGIRMLTYGAMIIISVFIILSLGGEYVFPRGLDNNEEIE